MCDNTNVNRICGRPVEDVMSMVLANGAERDPDLWRMVFCPKAACYAIGFCSEHGINPGNMANELRDTQPGQLLPRMLHHTGLWAPMYSYTREFWEAMLRLLAQALRAWMEELVACSIVSRHTHPDTGDEHWVWCRLRCEAWAAELPAMVDWVDRHLYATTARRSPLTPQHRDARIQQILELLNDLEGIPDNAEDQTPQQRRYLDELDRLLAQRGGDGGRGAGGINRDQTAEEARERRRNDDDDESIDEEINRRPNPDDRGDDVDAPTMALERHSITLEHLVRHGERMGVWFERLNSSMLLEGRFVEV